MIVVTSVYCKDGLRLLQTDCGEDITILYSFPFQALFRKACKTSERSLKLFVDLVLDVALEPAIVIAVVGRRPDQLTIDIFSRQTGGAPKPIQIASSARYHA